LRIKGQATRLTPPFEHDDDDDDDEKKNTNIWLSNLKAVEC